MHELLMVAALPLMLLGGLLVDAVTGDHDHNHKDDADDKDDVIGDQPEHEHPPLI